MPTNNTGKTDNTPNSPSLPRHAPCAMPPAPCPMRYALCALLLFLFSLTVFTLSGRLMGFLYYHRGYHARVTAAPDKAVYYLEKALKYHDRDPRIWKELGESYHDLTETHSDEDLLIRAKKAKNAYLKASRLNPLDAEAAYGMGRAENILEWMHPDRFHLQKINPYNAHPFYQGAIRLRPNGILYHYEFAHYLYRLGKIEEFWEVTRNLARIHPPVYGHLKKEKFWSSFVRKQVKKGLQQAIEQGILIRNAHINLSSLFSEEKDWPGAIEHYEKALLHDEIKNRSRDFLHLGRLYVENGQLEEAEKHFFKALSLSETREKDLAGLYGVYGKKGFLEDRYLFYHRVRERFPLSGQIDILVARALFDLKQYNQAKRVLEKLNLRDPAAEACYWLYRIAEMDKDLDGMELSIQKATVLNPKNSQYHLLLSHVLKRMKKWDSAEKQAGLAIKHATKSSPSLFNHRAWIRWSLKDYQGAIRDWKSAIALNPDKPAYYGWIANAYEKLGNWSEVMENYQKALYLDPKNEKYRKKYNALRTMNKE